jgi:hypothetical protein
MEADDQRKGHRMQSRMVRRVWSGAALICLATAAPMAQAPAPAQGAKAAAAPTGVIEGVLLNEQGQPVTLNGVYPTTITLVAANGKRETTMSDPPKGGFYTFRDVVPGVYEVFVEQSVIGMNAPERKTYRPQRVLGVAVGGGRRTVLNLTVHPGNALEEIGKPTLTSENALLVSDELKRLRTDLDALRAQVAALTKKAAPGSTP